MKLTKITDPAKISQLTFDENAQVRRTAHAGLELTPMGPINTAQRVGPGVPILVFNSGAAVAYVKFGNQSMAAPAGPADGIPILPNEKFVVNSGLLEWIIASSNSVYGYLGDNT